MNCRFIATLGLFSNALGDARTRSFKGILAYDDMCTYLSRWVKFRRTSYDFFELGVVWHESGRVVEKENEASGQSVIGDYPIRGHDCDFDRD